MHVFTPLKDNIKELHLYRQRLLISLVLVVGLLLVLLYRYANLQIVQHDRYATQSERNRVHVQPVAPKRGLIYDRNGRLLADNRSIYNLALVKERVIDMEATLGDLQHLFDIDSDSIEKFQQRLKRRKPYQSVPLKFQLSEDEISRFAVNRYRLPGVEIKAQLVRHYPLGESFAHVVGYVGRVNARELRDIEAAEERRHNYAATDYIGKIGLEQHYESALHGVVGSQHVETNAHGRVLRVLQQNDPVPGADLHLYLDAELQQMIASTLQGRRAAVVALDPQTGGILAMVSTPAYDANAFVTGIGARDYAALRDSLDLPLFNRAIQGQYPPGSTIKPIIGLAGLHYGLIEANTVVADPGWYQLPNDDRYYRDWKREGHGDFIALRQAIAQSCDIYFYDLAYRLGVDRIHAFSQHFGLGKATGIDSSSERSGLLPSREWKKANKNEPWFPGETLNIGIGQGYMLATPVQLAVATATLVNRGVRPVPRLVQSSGQRTRGAGESSTVAPRDVDALVEDVQDSDWRDVLDSLEEAVHGQWATARGAAEGASYRFAGKTGTAQVIGIAQGEEYDEEAIAERQRDHALFVGYAPLPNPEVVVAVVVENGGSGSTSAAPIARQVFDWVIARSHRDAEGEAQIALASQHR